MQLFVISCKACCSGLSANLINQSIKTFFSIATEHSKAGSVLRSLFATFGRGRTKSAIFTRSANLLATESVSSAPFGRGRTNVQVFDKEKSKLIATFSSTMVTSLPFFSLSLSPRAPHAPSAYAIGKRQPAAGKLVV